MTRLTPRQRDFLRRVYESNGGGVRASIEDERVIVALFGKGLIQGKKSNMYRVVHTAEGWWLARKLFAAEAKP